MEIGVVCGTGVGLAVLYRIVRPQFSISVNCHFCNSDIQVGYYQQNSFVCSQCDQYNGWNEEGDYNRVLDITPSNKYIQHQGSPGPGRDNGLCRDCNMNQELKVAQLAASPSEGLELEEYTLHLERVYRLCPACEDHVDDVLSNQDSKLSPDLLQFRLEQSILQQKNNKGEMNRSHRLQTTQTILSLFIFCLLHNASQSLVSSYLPYIPDSMMNFYLLNFITIPHLLLATSSILLLVSLVRFSVSGTMIHLPLLMSLSVPSTLHIIQLTLASITVIHSLLSSTSKRNSPSPTSKVKHNSTQRDSFITRKKVPQISSPIDETLTQNLIENSDVESIPRPVVVKPKSIFSPPSPAPIKMFNETSISHEFALSGDDSCDLSSLSLGETNNSPIPRSPFQRKIYSPSSPSNTLFSPRAKQILLHPSKLTNTSWVAGGYWTGGMPIAVTENISRASSQSSGFISGTPSQINFSPQNSPTGSIRSGFFPPATANDFQRSNYGVESERYSLLSSPINYPPSHIESPELRRISNRRPTLDDRLSQTSEELDRSSQITSSTPPSNSGWTMTVTITPLGVLLTFSIAVNLALGVLWMQQE